ncbi:GH3 domain-containing protein [Pelobates fuscus]|uniref:GH3 domain-containing protein n=1 Tax=Pelobates fuscus TaxID=191477 RepID=UPI002FE47E20
MLILIISTLFLGSIGIIYLLVIWKGWTLEGWLSKIRRRRCLCALSKQKQRQILESDTKNAQATQETLLLEILQKLVDTERGKEYHFNKIKDVSSFKSVHPLTRYHHYKDYIDRMLQGEENILLPSEPFTFVATAGTSGSCTVVPVKTSIINENFLQGTMVCLEVIQNSFPGALENVARFHFPPNQNKFETQKNFSTWSSASSSLFLKDMCCTPTPHPSMTHHEVMYTQILFALKDPCVTVLEANFSWVLREVFSFMESNWETMVTDIQRGYLNTDLKIPQEIRRHLEACLIQDSNRAADLKTQFENGFCGLAKRIWPKLQVIMAVGSGSSELDTQILKNTVCQGIPFYSPTYCSAEGLIGVNLWPENAAPRYVLCPRSALFEFIPLGMCKEEQPDTVCLQDVQVGEAYELVLTNRAGLCRYRLGDVVRVADFHNHSPILEFLFRRSQTLSVRGECISEDEFYKTLLYTVKLWPGATLLNYCCLENGILGPFSGGSDMHYEVFVALKGVRDLSEEQRYKLDQALQDHFPIYKSFRFKGSIGPVRVHLVSNQSFFKLLVLAASLSGAPLDHIQPPRTLKYRNLAESMQKQVLS